MSTPRLVRNINPGASSSSPSNLTQVGNRLYFTADDGSNGITLWKSNGTAAGTVRVDNNRRFVSPPSNLTAVGNTLFFTADDGITGTELWQTRGTAASTVQLRDIYPGSRGSDPRYLTQVDRTLFFSADTGGRGTGRELWQSDGTTTGTSIVSNITGANNSSNPSNLTPAGTELFFTANRNNQIWKSDGSTTGTVQVSNFSGFSSDDNAPRELTPLGGTIFFTADSDFRRNREVWRSDGTSTGTLKVSNFNSLNTSTSSRQADPRDLTVIGSTLFFSAGDSASGRELWRTNGTPASTVLVADIRSGPDSSAPRYLTKVGNTLFFAAFDDTSGTELWKSDGTAAGTALVADISPGFTSSNPRDLTAVGNTLFFTADDGNSGRELWQSDGTAAGTTRVADIRPGSFGSNPSNLMTVGDTLFFSADNGNSGQELWTLEDAYPPLPPPTITAAGRNNRITAAPNSRSIRGRDATPLAEVEILRGNLLLGTTTSNRNGAFFYDLTPGNIERLGQGTGKRVRARQSDGAGNTAISPNYTFTINTTRASRAQDLLTGERRSRDTFFLPDLQNSLLNRYDTITNYESIDRLRVRGSRYNSSLTLSSGRIRDLDARQINNRLGRGDFAPGEAAAFQVRDMAGTFIALNDNRPGFQANSDAVIFLEGFNINQSANAVTVI